VLTTLAIAGVIIGGLVVLLVVYACGVVSGDTFEGEAHEPALPAEGPHAHLAMVAPEPGLAPLLPPLRPSEPRDPSVGVDQARAEVRARIHRYNNREVS
jgi:hypothetical protein